MNRNTTLYIVIGVLVAVLIVLGYLYYQSQQATHSVSVNLGDKGISIESK